jgi:lipoyl(octanoyl) transferase
VLFDAPVILLRSPARTAAENMACDHAMSRVAAARDCVVVRLYTWTAPSLSLGRHQRTHGSYSAKTCAQAGVDVVRRPTGGRALLHWREQTYAVAAPAARVGSLRESYGDINDWLMAGLAALGVPATPAPVRGRLAAPGLAPCFAEPAAGELIVSGAKLVGSAQVRDTVSMLQHGSILLHDDQAQLEALALAPLPELPRPATLSGVLGREVSAAEVADALCTELKHRSPQLDAPADDLDWLGSTVSGALVQFSDPLWTWCR